MKHFLVILLSGIFLLLAGCAHPKKMLFSYQAENSNPGIYGKTDLARDWKQPRWENGVSQGLVSIIEDSDPAHPKALRVLYPKGSFSDSKGPGKIQWTIDFGKGYREIYFSYDLKFDENFDFVKGGKLHGVAGGKHNSGGKKPDGNDGWSSRVIWLSGSRIGQYIYHADQPSTYGEVFPYTAEGKDIIIERGRWYRITNRVVLNTPGKKDGIVQAWIDGLSVFDRRTIRFRDVDSLETDVFYFTTFFGGGDETYAAVKDEYIYFDNFIISTKPTN